MEVIALLVATIFIFLSGLHLYWVLFGIKDPTQVLPTTEEGKLMMKPGKVGTLLVGLFLALFASVYLNKALKFIHVEGLTYVSMGIGFLFLARTIGDFKYVGFFKSVKSTNFAFMDTRYYSPLTLMVAVLIFILEMWG
ncbi:MAG: DUF3995 domain-containing protein [Flavobacteriaceae bacterium]|uniref:DUF3995 domain-containing protein n=1 Tax=Flagellimonas TaxID=444459 RepID=UPI003BA8C6D7|nr:DUF3995 domain-containing protein [Flavobacteriaceae bacterium]